MESVLPLVFLFIESINKSINKYNCFLKLLVILLEHEEVVNRFGGYVCVDACVGNFLPRRDRISPVY